MYNNRFFIKKNKIKISNILDIDKNANLNNINKDTEINFLSPLEYAKNGDLSFFTTSIVSKDKYKKHLLNTKASFVLMKKEFQNINQKIQPIITNDPYIVFNKMLKEIYVENNKNINLNCPKIDKTAKIHNYSSIGKNVIIKKNTTIDEFVKIGNNVEIGENTIIKAGVKIGNNCVIGDNCIIMENCVIQYTEIGNNCFIHANSTIGQDGFGYIFSNITNKYEKIYHFSYVKIGNNVEIHSNSCIDRGVLEPTIINNNVKIDNLVQIGHNVKIGENTIIAGQTGIGGSTSIGKNCLLGGKNAIIGHIDIGDSSTLYSNSFITKSYPKKSKIIGYPADLYKNWIKNNAKLKIFLKKKDKNKK